MTSLVSTATAMPRVTGTGPRLVVAEHRLADPLPVYPGIPAWPEEILALSRIRGHPGRRAEEPGWLNMGVEPQ
jgi:hypothetical protein